MPMLCSLWYVMRGHVQQQDREGGTASKKQDEQIPATLDLQKEASREADCYLLSTSYIHPACAHAHTCTRAQTFRKDFPGQELNDSPLQVLRCGRYGK